ncbi:hypothetical protein IWX89_003481 [Cryobacterium sp. MP_M3]|uniref:hypothetical protein n=1 Tax=unclassified Cryobacterium TaxID=2649013 RepID=UPI0018C91E6D|nr:MULTISPECIES: hypothetical protein [unclassified Cryobacterium]MBG6060008.1 hypothetical protein [Cryobacterium sp. MP_M3]
MRERWQNSVGETLGGFLQQLEGVPGGVRPKVRHPSSRVHDSANSADCVGDALAEVLSVAEEWAEGAVGTRRLNDGRAHQQPPV